MQDWIEEVAGTDAGKRPAGTVRSVRARSQTQNQKTRPGVAEARDRFGPVIPFHISASFDLPDFPAVRDQPRTARTRNDFLIDLSEAGLNQVRLRLAGRHLSKFSSIRWAGVLLPGQGVQEGLRAVQWIDMQRRLLFGNTLVGVQHYGRDFSAMSFRTKLASFRQWERVRDDHGANMPAAQDLQRGFNRRSWNHPISSVRQDRIPDGPQHLLRGNRQDCRSHRQSFNASLSNVSLSNAGLSTSVSLSTPVPTTRLRPKNVSLAEVLSCGRTNASKKSVTFSTMVGCVPKASEPWNTLTWEPQLGWRAPNGCIAIVASLA